MSFISRHGVIITLERRQDLNILRVAIDAHPTPDELEKVVTSLEATIRRQEIPRLLFYLGHHCGIHAEALLAEVLIRHWATALEQTSSVWTVPERIAFVGDTVWHTWATEIVGPVLRPEVRFFPAGRRG